MTSPGLKISTIIFAHKFLQNSFCHYFCGQVITSLTSLDHRPPVNEISHKEFSKINFCVIHFETGFQVLNL